MTLRATTTRRVAARRVLLGLASIAGLWAFATWTTGGFAVELGPLRVSSRNVRNPLVLAVLAAGLAWVLAPRGRRRATLAEDWRASTSSLERTSARLSAHSRWWSAAGVTLLAAGVVWFGISRGSLVAGGADSYGYVSQAHLWATGRLHVEQPFVRAPPGGLSPEALVPLAYRLGPDGGSLVPVYAPGLPMLMGVFERLGGPDAVFLVMPLLAGVAVWATYLLGAAVAGPLGGMIAAVLLATSPAFVFQLTHAPMSDIPATAWWTIALVLSCRASRSSASAAGLAAGLAILTRPNLVPVALVPGALFVWNVATSRPDRTHVVSRLVLFAGASIPACLVVAYLNHVWYGSVLESGYGSLTGTLYRWTFFWPNLSRFPRWLVDSQGPWILLAALAPLLLWRARPRGGDASARTVLLVALTFAMAVYGCYAVYMPFEAWWFLRFLLPAFPVLFAAVGAVLLGLPRRVPWFVRVVAPAAVLMLLLSHAIGFGRTHDAFDAGAERRFATAGRYVAGRLPARAVVVSMLHSGSARYYSGRLTIRYDAILPWLLEPALADFLRLGYQPFLLLDASEREAFGAQFAGTTLLDRLDELPSTEIDGVTIYDVSAVLPRP